MSKNNFIAVFKYKYKYYVIKNLNADLDDIAIKYLFYQSLKNYKLKFTKNRGLALCIAHDIQKKIDTEYGVIEINID